MIFITFVKLLIFPIFEFSRNRRSQEPKKSGTVSNWGTQEPPTTQRKTQEHQSKDITTMTKYINALKTKILYPKLGLYTDMIYLFSSDHHGHLGVNTITKKTKTKPKKTFQRGYNVISVLYYKVEVPPAKQQFC